MDGRHDDFDISVERAILRVASRPPMPGILMSISTTSTAFVRHHLTASSPHDASPTTFYTLYIFQNASYPCAHQFVVINK